MKILLLLFLVAMIQIQSRFTRRGGNGYTYIDDNPGTTLTLIYILDDYKKFNWKRDKNGNDLFFNSNSKIESSSSSFNSIIFIYIDRWEEKE